MRLDQVNIISSKPNLEQKNYKGIDIQQKFVQNLDNYRQYKRKATIKLSFLLLTFGIIFFVQFLNKGLGYRYSFRTEKHINQIDQRLLVDIDTQNIQSSQQKQLKEQRSFIKRKRDQLYVKQSKKYQQSKIQIKPQSKFYQIKLSPRTKLGQPYIPEYQFKTWKFSSNSQEEFQRNQNCIFINSVNNLNINTIKTIQGFLKKKDIGAIYLITSRNDFKGEYFIDKWLKKYIKQSQKMIIDADYTFGSSIKKHCSKLVYMFGHFVFNNQMIKNVVYQIENLKPSSLFFTSNYFTHSYTQSKLLKLDDLQKKNLSAVQPDVFNQYIYIFETQFLDIITPVNFIFYVKYTFEQTFLMPILILYQTSKRLYTNQKIFHSFSINFVNFKQFTLQSIKKQKNSICFVSYPINPNLIQEQSFLDYVNSIIKQQQKLTNRQNQQILISIIIYLPYKFDKSPQLYRIAKQLLSIKNQIKTIKIKLRIMSQKAVSSYAVYDSVYTYCPSQSLIVSSRHNAKFKKQFSRQLLEYVSQKYHYYVFDIQQNQQILTFSNNYTFQLQFTTNKWKIYEQRLQFVQVFKSDFMKTGMFYYLKCQQVDFYQTEQAFVVHMMKMTKLTFGYINKTLVSIKNREYTQIELKQIKAIKSYGKLFPIPNNQLIPYRYNCLENKILRRNSPKLIPANLHQIWFGQQKISRVRMVLRDTLMQKNNNFTFYLWRNNNITKSSAPISYSLIQRVFQYHKYYKSSLYAMAADLLRVELLVSYGGIYIDFKFEGMKALDNFLKYENVFNDFDIGQIRYGSPKAIGNGILGATKNNYHLKFYLTELIQQQRISIKFQIPKVSGGFVLRQSVTDKQMLVSLGYGCHLFFPRPYEPIVDQCGGVDKKFDRDQQVFVINFHKSPQPIKMGIPCKQYPQAYVIMFKPLSETWIGTKRNNTE